MDRHHVELDAPAFGRTGSVIRYGHIIGYANRPIAHGSWVREDHLAMPAAPSLDDLPLATATPEPLPPLEGYTFEGYRNPDGAAGTRNILGIAIKYGEDRFLTRQIVKAGYLTTMTLDARCRTFVPSTLSAYFSQQLRWRRSNIVDYTGGFSHVWRLNPVLAIHFFSLFALLLIYPIAVVRALAAHKFFPALVLHTEAVVFFGMLYRWRNRKLPEQSSVPPPAGASESR